MSVSQRPIHTPIPTQQVPQPIEQPIHTEVPKGNTQGEYRELKGVTTL